MSIRTILVDDEPLATQGLQLRLQAHDDIEVVNLDALTYAGNPANLAGVALMQMMGIPFLRRMMMPLMKAPSSLGARKTLP